MSVADERRRQLAEELVVQRWDELIGGKAVSERGEDALTGCFMDERSTRVCRLVHCAILE